MAAIAATIFSANARTLWTGNCTYADYQVASGDRPIFTPEDFNGVVVGDKLIFNITNNPNDPQSWHQVEIWQWDGEKPGPAALGQGVHILEGMTTAEFTIDETLLQGLLAGPTCAAGTGYTVRSIEVTTFDGVIWEGVCNCPEWVPSPAVTLPGSKFAVAKEGDVLVFSVEKIKAGEYAAIQIDKATTFNSGPFGTVEIADGQTEVRVVLNAELLASLVTDGINITGMNFRLFKITLTDGSDVPPIEDDAIWSGTMTAGNWAQSLTIGADKLATVKAGDILAFTVSEADADAQISLKENIDGWAEMPSDEGEFGNYIHITDGPGIYYFSINEAAAASMRANGMVVAGLGYTLTKIELQAAPVEETAVWQGSLTAGDWQNSLTIEASKLAGVNAGDLLSFTVTAADADAQISLKQNLPEGWAEMPSDEGEFGNYIHITDGPGTYYFKVNEQAAASMHTYGMVVAGLGYTLTQVAVVEGSADDAVDTILSSSAVAAPVYNLSGVKVADSMESVTVPGIYISGGKKFVVK